MAKEFNAMCTTFKKVSGFSEGACKPTTQTATGASNIATLVSSVVGGTSNLDAGESINIVITCKEVSS